MSPLYSRIYTIYVLAGTLLAKCSRFAANPIVLRILPLLQEQRDHAYQALMILRYPLDPLRKNHLRECLEVIFRDEEAYHPLFQAWDRYQRWHPSSEDRSVQGIVSQERQQHQQLVSLVPVITALYGIQETKYIIPPLLRAEYTQEVGAPDELAE